MMGIAGGMAARGIALRAYFRVFATRRAYDQVAMQIAYPRPTSHRRLHAGADDPLGPRTRPIDDIALMRARRT